jgi:hypothetical protein
LLDYNFDLEPEKIEIEEYDEFENNVEFYNNQKNSLLQAEDMNYQPNNDFNQYNNVFDY